MLRRYATVAFAVLGLLLCDWEDPSPESTLVLDAFFGIAEIMDTLETDPSARGGTRWTARCTLNG